jgi:hypothetical protein
MDIHKENSDGQSKDLSIDIDIHRETGLIIVNKIGIPDQGIELTVDDVEALSDFARQHGDKLARLSDFNEVIKEGKRLTDHERRKIGREKIAALRLNENKSQTIGDSSGCERCGKPVEPGTSSTLCPSCHEDSLSAAEKDMDVQEGGLHVDKGQTISTSSMSETAPPNFPKSIYEKLVIKFKGDKKKINEVMWELHKKSKESGKSLDEKAPPGFPKDLHDRLLNQYKDEPAKAYATMWKIHNKYGDKLESVVNEIKKKKTVKKSDRVEDDEDEIEAKFRKSKAGKEYLKKHPQPEDWSYTDPGRNAPPTNGWN